MAAVTQQAAPVVYTQAQPLGEAGVNFSLMKVAEYATAGRKDVPVVAMARRIIRDSKCDPRNDLACARAVHGWMQAHGIKWLRDPARVEFMAEARHFIFTTDDSGKSRDDALMVSADCDELTILLAALSGAMAQSVGVENIAILGHSYARSRMIGHVLFAVHDGSKWTRVDPSSDKEFGWYRSDFTREKMIAIPSCREICDGDSCASGPRAVRPPPLQSHGDFVGVSGLESETMRKPQFVNLGDAEEVGPEVAAVWFGLMTANADEAQGALDELDRQHASMLEVFAALGADPMANAYGWGPLEEEAYQTIRKAGAFIIEVHRAAAQGDRKVQLFPEDNRYAISALPSDTMAIDVEDSGLFAIVKGIALEVVGGAIKAEVVTGIGVGAGQVAIIVGGVVVVALLAAGYFAWSKLCGDAAAVAREAKQKAFADLTAECARNNTPEKCQKLILSVGEAASASAREDRKRAEAQTSRTKWRVAAAGGTVVVVSAAAAAAWWYLQKKRRKAAA